jgi:HAE1 family hydrophobic/amphiphilic exporter-1
VLAGAALALLVLIFFLRNVRSTVIVATGIPISIIGMFTLMYYFDVTLNLISFGGVALGIGMLVDNAIVILENIFRKYEEGLQPKQAAIEGSREVAGAIVASTTTTLVVFVPVIFLTGLASIFFGQMAFVVSFALICSLLVALTLIPVLSSQFLKDGAQPDEDSPIGRALSGLDRLYGAFVDACLRHPWITLLTGVAMLGGALALTPMLGTELMPTGDQSEVRVRVELPVGTRIEVTDAAIRRVESIVVNEIPEATTMQTVIGTPGFWSTSGGESANITVKVVDPDRRDRSSEEIANQLRPKLEGLIPGADLRVRAGGGLWILRMLRGGGERLEVQVRGYDLQEAQRLSDQVKEIMTSIEGVSGARVSRQPGAREIRVIPDREKIAALGLSYDTVASEVQTYLQGTRATVLRERGDEFNVIVKLPEEQTEGIDALLDLPIVIPEIGTTPLRNVVEIDEAKSPLTIERLNQSRVVEIDAILTGERDLGSIAGELRGEIRQMEIPDDFSVLVTGEQKEQEKTFQGLLIGIVLAMLLVYMVMAAQFESFLHPFLIMFSIPFAAIGAIVALVVTGTTFNIQSFMGCVVLIGIVVNNAIVLIDYINLMRREHGMAVTDAVALSARRRLRPILMTSATTMLALIPVAIGFAEGGEAQAPLARVVIGGMFTSSLISLVIIPVLYNSIEGWRERRSSERGPSFES